MATYAWFDGYGPDDDGVVRAPVFGERRPFRDDHP